ALTGFVQDAVGAGAIGPNVRIDLGQVVPAAQPVTVRIRWSGALTSPEGGPLANKRLAYVGPEGSYLMYASRWFPFHDYAADRATADITIIGELMGHGLEFYTNEYGNPAFGNRFVIAQTDDETMDAYSGPGMLFLASKFFDTTHGSATERLEREVAYQWWGQSVGLKSFDDAWISQGLAEWSAFALRESTLNGAPLDAAQREEQERALTFEQTSSIVRAPSALDDQSAAYQ